MLAKVSNDGFWNCPSKTTGRHIFASFLSSCISSFYSLKQRCDGESSYFHFGLWGMRHILKMAEHWVRYNFGLWELSGTELPSQQLPVSEFLHKREIISIFEAMFFFSFFCCLQLNLILICHISMKSENQKDTTR